MQPTDTLTSGSLHPKPFRSALSRAIYSFLIVMLIAISFPSGSYAQQQQGDVVTNLTIIQLYRAGVGKQVILAKIENSQCNFDLSTTGLVTLNKNGVPDDIVSTMISKASNNQNAQPQAQGNGPDPNAQQTIDPNATVQANTAPPELPNYEQPPCPVDGYLWVPGYWAFNAADGYYWVPGVWVAPPNPGLLWTPAYWGYDGGFYVFHHGYWGHSVGFYGGINYGYGYGGVGFIGGGWHGNVYRYNTAVVRVNTVVIHNTYVDRTVINNTTVINNRTSFNGGNGGVQAQPKPQEIAAMKENHIQPTQEQQSHQQLASTDKNQFARVNNGRPAQTALPKVSEAATRNANAGNPNAGNANPGNNNGGNKGGNNGGNNPNHPNGSNLPGNNNTPPAANNEHRPTNNPASTPGGAGAGTGAANTPATGNANNTNPANGANRAVKQPQQKAPKVVQQHNNNNPKPSKKNNKNQ